MSSVPPGLLPPWSTWGKFNQIEFVVSQLLAKLQTVTLVKVISCTNEGNLSPVGTVNVQPLVNQVDSDGNPFPHTTIYNVPYFRLASSGGNAVILDPVNGDIGLCCFASRDLTSVIANKAAANPGSQRKYDFSDALYVGLMVGGGTPTQYVRFVSSGIEIISPGEITIKAPTINLEGNVRQSNGTIIADTDVLAGPSSISLVNHQHTSSSPGSPTSPPIP